MVDLFSERRMVENEVIFRQLNERAQESLENLQKEANENGEKPLPDSKGVVLHFYCECSDENCRKRIVMKLGVYKKHHKEKDQFIILPGHQVTEIERIIHKQHKYYVVQKLLNPPEVAHTLHDTEVDNS